MEHIADEANFFESIFSTAAWGFVYCGLWESYVDLIYGPFSLKDHIFIIDQNSTAHGTARPFVTIFYKILESIIVNEELLHIQL